MNQYLFRKLHFHLFEGENTDVDAATEEGTHIETVCQAHSKESDEIPG